MHFTSVDLPAPLSPSSASTSPRIGLEAHVLQRVHGAEVLLRVTDGEDGCRGGHWRARRLKDPRARLEVVAQHVGLDRQHDDHADGDHLVEDLDVRAG